MRFKIMAPQARGGWYVRVQSRGETAYIDDFKTVDEARDWMDFFLEHHSNDGPLKEQADRITEDFRAQMAVSVTAT
jgi:hypothetical protein